MAAIEDLVRYASENARSVQRLYDDDPWYVPVSAIALANVVEQLVAALTAAQEAQAEGRRVARESAWYDGYDACRHGQQRHNPHRVHRPSILDQVIASGADDG